MNYTLTNYANHTEQFSHDMANRYLAEDEVRPRLVWENVKDQMEITPYGLLLFDDTVIDKNYSHKNEMVQNNTEVVHDLCGFRWKVEQFHRETKQLTGIEGNQCRKARLVRNHIGCAILVWVRLKQVAFETKQTIYRVKQGIWDDYLRQQIKSPSVLLRLA